MPTTSSPPASSLKTTFLALDQPREFFLFGNHPFRALARDVSWTKESGELCVGGDCEDVYGVTLCVSEVLCTVYIRSIIDTHKRLLARSYAMNWDRGRGRGRLFIYLFTFFFIIYLSIRLLIIKCTCVFTQTSVFYSDISASATSGILTL